MHFWWSLDQSSFQLIYLIRNVFFQGLQITSFPTDFIVPADLQGHSIVGLELGMNKISHLEAGVLDKYPELAYLILDNNEIDFIDDNGKVLYRI